MEPRLCNPAFCTVVASMLDGNHHDLLIHEQGDLINYYTYDGSPFPPVSRHQGRGETAADGDGLESCPLEGRNSGMDCSISSDSISTGVEFAYHTTLLCDIPIDSNCIPTQYHREHGSEVTEAGADGNSLIYPFAKLCLPLSDHTVSATSFLFPYIQEALYPMPPQRQVSDDTKTSPHASHSRSAPCLPLPIVPPPRLLMSVLQPPVVLPTAPSAALDNTWATKDSAYIPSPTPPLLGNQVAGKVSPTLVSAVLYGSYETSCHAFDLLLHEIGWASHFSLSEVYLPLLSLIITRGQLEHAMAHVQYILDMITPGSVLLTTPHTKTRVEAGPQWCRYSGLSSMFLHKDAYLNLYSDLVDWYGTILSLEEHSSCLGSKGRPVGDDHGVDAAVAIDDDNSYDDDTIISTHMIDTQHSVLKNHFFIPSRLFPILFLPYAVLLRTLLQRFPSIRFVQMQCYALPPPYNLIDSIALNNALYFCLSEGNTAHIPLSAKENHDLRDKNDMCNSDAVFDSEMRRVSTCFLFTRADLSEDGVLCPYFSERHPVPPLQQSRASTPCHAPHLSSHPPPKHDPLQVYAPQLFVEQDAVLHCPLLRAWLGHAVSSVWVTTDLFAMNRHNMPVVAPSLLAALHVLCGQYGASLVLSSDVYSPVPPFNTDRDKRRLSPSGACYFATIPSNSPRGGDHSAFQRGNRISNMFIPVYEPRQTASHKAASAESLRIRETPLSTVLEDTGVVGHNPSALQTTNAFISRLLGSRHTILPSIYTIYHRASGKDHSPTPHATTPLIFYAYSVRQSLHAPPPLTQQAAFESDFRDVLQMPIDPLNDHLQDGMYSVFERDPVKYVRYREAIQEALLQLRTAQGQDAQGQDTQGQDAQGQDGSSFIADVAVFGAGRGPLVDCVISASVATGIPVTLTAVEKNPYAYTLLLQRCYGCGGDASGQCSRIVSESPAGQGPAGFEEPQTCICMGMQRVSWAHVELICADIRRLDEDDRHTHRYHIIVSELLGSFGDNELAPECLHHIDRYLKPMVTPMVRPGHPPFANSSLLSRMPCINQGGIPSTLRGLGGISIPSSSRSFLAPVSCFSLHHAIQSMECPLRQLNTPFVVRLHRFTVLSPAQPCFAFDYPPRPQLQPQSVGKGDDFLPPVADPSLNRDVVLTFPITQPCIIHGVVGYFDATLFQSVSISIHPESHSPGMFSWFPVFFPFVHPLTYHRRDSLVIHFSRINRDNQVWYEYCVNGSTYTHNKDGIHSFLPV